jgi:toxin ParE1/3/4
MARRIRDAIDGLTICPGRGRGGRVQGTRELVVPDTPFVVACRIGQRQIEVLAILHGARRWPRSC